MTYVSYKRFFVVGYFLNVLYKTYVARISEIESDYIIQAHNFSGRCLSNIINNNNKQQQKIRMQLQ